MCVRVCPCTRVCVCAVVCVELEHSSAASIDSSVTEKPSSDCKTSNMEQQMGGERNEQK